MAVKSVLWNPFANRKRLIRVASVCALASACVATTASAQFSNFGGTNLVIPSTVRGTDAAFSLQTGGYLVVGGWGAVRGVCVNANGAATSSVFTIKNAAGYFGSFPRAKYSPDVNGGSGGFLVTWPEERSGGIMSLKARIVTCSGVIGSEQTIDNGVTAFGESGAAIGYSRKSQKFLVAWRTQANARVVARLVGLNAAGIGSVVTLSSGFGRDPGVAWNSVYDEFGVSFSGETSTSVYSALVRVPVQNVAGFARKTFNSFSGGMTTITDIDYNSANNRYVMAWHEIRSTTTRYAMIAEFDGAGTLLTKGIASSRMGSYDALSLGYNPVSRTFLLVGVNPMNDEVWSAELNSRGYRFTTETKVASTTLNHYTRVAPSRFHARWASNFSANNFAATANQIVQTTSSGGGPSGAYASQSSGTTSGGTTSGGSSSGSSSGGTTCPGSAPVAGWVCVNGNWLPPEIAGTSSCPGSAPGSGWTCVNGNWLPPTMSTSSCPGTAPGSGWTCSNGNWLPPGYPH